MSSSFSNSSSLSLSSFSSSSGDGSGKKLSFPSLPAKFEPPGTETPPLETSATVPFRWEEAPGRPRASNDTKQDRNDKKCLDLPPRLLLVTERHGGRRITDMPSPTTVLDGPDLGRSVAYGVSFRSFRSPESFEKRERAGYFGSSRWGGSFGKDNVVVGNGADFLGGEGIIDFSALGFGGRGGDSADGEDACDLKMPKTKKGTKSHIWGSIYGSLKQIVPWKRRERARK